MKISHLGELPAVGGPYSPKKPSAILLLYILYKHKDLPVGSWVISKAMHVSFIMKHGFCCYKKQIYAELSL